MMSTLRLTAAFACAVIVGLRARGRRAGRHPQPRRRERSARDRGESRPDAANGTLTATVNGATITKPITREVFASPTSVCRE